MQQSHQQELPPPRQKCQSDIKMRTHMGHTHTHTYEGETVKAKLQWRGVKEIHKK